MRMCRTILSLVCIGPLLALAAAQQGDDNLPSAPSATVEESKPKPKPKPAPPATQQTQSAPAQPAPAPPAASPPAAAPPAESSAAPAPAASGKAGANQAPLQLETTQPEDEATTIRTNVNEVNVVFTVTDRHGRYIKDLTKEDFKVIDDGRPARGIRSFRRETDLPLQLGLLVDASNSVRDRFKFEQESAIEFLNQTVRPTYDKAMVVGFDATPEVTQDFTDDTGLLSHGVRMLRPGGGTALYDALYYACRDKLGKQPQTGAVRRAIILLSDGDDNQSHVSREEAIEMAQRVEAIIYTISTNVTGSAGPGDKVLTRIAEATGGRAFFPFQITDVANFFSEIQDELRSQYSLSYSPSDFIADGRFRTIEIIAQNHKNLRVRTRHGYYAPVVR